MKKTDTDSFQQYSLTTSGSGHKLKHKSLSENNTPPFYCEGGQIQEQVAQRS